MTLLKDKVVGWGQIPGKTDERAMLQSEF